MTFQRSSYSRNGIEEDDDSQTRFLLYFSVNYKSTINLRFYFFPISFSNTPIVNRFTKNRVSSSPSPSYGVELASGGSNFQQSCSGSSRNCQTKNITACLTYSQSETCLFVHNNGENTLHVKIVILPARNTIKEVNITSHQTKKVNISSDVDLSSAIALTTSDGDCIITSAAAPPPENHYHKHSSYETYITPINGAYLVFLLLVVGGILIFYKLMTRGRHLEGIQYHELEMGNSAAENMEKNETENWDEDWNDDWDDEKPIKSSTDDHVLVKQANDIPTKLPNSNGRRKECVD
ncbi:hypothetical protein E3N88_12865 [Mikania micrantha]|uniref:DUF7356 domain-containing protein n=1 Tax=Mikania micrantha TaxID=192012 RepID=A0A5N6P9P2_9ASTR|nr:hypothetical protein E3N88_12865 [Mikania micrantha]